MIAPAKQLLIRLHVALRTNPYVYPGWVSVGVDHDTAEFAVESIRRWWKHMGKVSYPQAKALLITADGGGSNASRNRLWKVELQKFANERKRTTPPSKNFSGAQVSLNFF